jgi:NAD(P)H-dependent FMN reductase
LRNKIKNSRGCIIVTPEYDRSTSGALKNTLDYFLEEYYFEPSATVSYSLGMFGGINAAQQLRLVFAELDAISIPTSFPISKVHKVFDENNNLLDEAYNERLDKVLNEFEWYIEALEKQRERRSLINLKHHKNKIVRKDKYLFKFYY